jgi:hypothetical protein
MRRPSAAVDLSRGQPSAPLGCVPKSGESWLPIGRKALVGAAYLAPVDLVRPMVPEEFEVVSVLPGRTLATVFVADYGPGSTLEYHEFGLQPALVDDTRSHDDCIGRAYTVISPYGDAPCAKRPSFN